MQLEVEKERNGRKEIVKTIKQGIFAYTNYKANIPEEIRIKKNSMFIKLDDDNNIELDNDEFEKYFDVYAKSKIIAYQVLTHDVMQVLVDFYKKTAIDFEVILRNKSAYIMFYTGKIFEPQMFKKSTNMQILWVQYLIIEFITKLVVEINKALKDTII